MMDSIGFIDRFAKLEFRIQHLIAKNWLNFSFGRLVITFQFEYNFSYIRNNCQLLKTLQIIFSIYIWKMRNSIDGPLAYYKL